MNLMKMAIAAIVAAMAVWPASVARAQGKDEPSSTPVEDPNALWREYLSLPDDPFLVHGTGQNEPAWVKFTIVLQKRRFEDANGVVIETTFYWPPAPKGLTAGYTAPLAHWVETRITGYTTEPIVLGGLDKPTITIHD
jgi:hypothetical protein